MVRSCAHGVLCKLKPGAGVWRRLGRTPFGQLTIPGEIAQISRVMSHSDIPSRRHCRSRHAVPSNPGNQGRLFTSFTPHTPRVANVHLLAPEGVKVVMALEVSIRKSGLEASLLHLIKLRASQINHRSRTRRDCLDRSIDARCRNRRARCGLRFGQGAIQRRRTGELTLAIGAINVWNRLQVAFRASHPTDAVHAKA